MNRKVHWQQCYGALWKLKLLFEKGDLRIAMSEDNVVQFPRIQRNMERLREYLTHHWFHGDEDNADCFLMYLWIEGFKIVPVEDE